MRQNLRQLLETGKIQMKEKRRARRFSLPVTLSEINGKPAPQARILDLSSNGAKLELPFDPRLRDQLTFLCLLPGQEKPRKLIGAIVWKKPAPTEGMHVVGLQFYQNYWDLDQLLRTHSVEKT